MLYSAETYLRFLKNLFFFISKTFNSRLNVVFTNIASLAIAHLSMPSAHPRRHTLLIGLVLVLFRTNLGTQPNWTRDADENELL